MFPCSLKPNGTQHCGQQKRYSNDTEGMFFCNSIHWLTFCQWHTVKHKLCTACCVSVCIELCTHRARTLVAILWLNSEWQWLCLRERVTETKGGRPAAGFGPESVRKEILGIARTIKKKKKIQIYQWSLHNLLSRQHWIRIQVVALKSKVHVISVKTLRHRDGIVSCCYSEQCCTTRLAIIPPILQSGLGGGWFVQD